MNVPTEQYVEGDAPFSASTVTAMILYRISYLVHFFFFSVGKTGFLGREKVELLFRKKVDFFQSGRPSF